LRTSDLVTNFGVLNSSNFSEINQIVEVVRNNVNQEIHIKLLREIDPADAPSGEEEGHTYKGKVYKLISTSIIPRKWEGEGVLG